ncbi:hypothetical protein SAMN04487980_104058 [Streptomyces sp. cf124]|nr:hypothetical protein SAMN04487980_104058 [Streptomyces sp. cf124]
MHAASASPCIISNQMPRMPYRRSLPRWRSTRTRRSVSRSEASLGARPHSMRPYVTAQPAVIRSRSGTHCARGWRSTGRLAASIRHSLSFFDSNGSVTCPSTRKRCIHRSSVDGETPGSARPASSRSALLEESSAFWCFIFDREIDSGLRACHAGIFRGLWRFTLRPFLCSGGVSHQPIASRQLVLAVHLRAGFTFPSARIDRTEVQERQARCRAQTALISVRRPSERPLTRLCVLSNCLQDHLCRSEGFEHR